MSNKRFIIQHYVRAGEFRGHLLRGNALINRSMGSGTELAREIQLTDWSTAGEQGKPVQPVLWYGAPNQSIFPTFFYGLFDFLYTQLDFLYGQHDFLYGQLFTFYMVNTTFYMANYSLFIWSTRLFIWSTNHFLYGQLTIFIWSTNHFLYGQHDFFMVNFRIFSNDDHNEMRPNSNKGRPIAGTLHKPQRKCRKKTRGLMSHTMVLHVL